jgi:excisionase family DNA binding protein
MKHSPLGMTIPHKYAHSEWLTPTEAAAYHRIRPATLLLWARRGKVPAHRLSGSRRCVWRFLKSELDAMLSAPTVCSNERMGDETSTTV